MLSALLKFFHRPALRFGLARDSRGRFRDPRFVSFLSQNNRKTLNTDFQDAVLRGRRLARNALIVAAAAGAAWIVLESAKALSLF
jgi:Pyruvate/2-oxoacid:ferredoxin oxidoreductase gamma subunit